MAYTRDHVHATIKKKILSIVYALAKMATIIYFSMTNMRRPKGFTNP